MSSFVSYSTLEEAWGTNNISRKSRKSKSRRSREVVEEYPRHARSRRNRSLGDKTDIHPFSVISDAPKVTNRKEEPLFPEELDADNVAETIEPFREVDNSSLKTKPIRANENHDVFLYVFSGVLLLFVLEQFIQLGLHMGMRDAKY